MSPPPSSRTGRPLPSRLTISAVYQPSTRPGAPLPHAWIDDDDGNRRPLKDLVAPGHFLLIAGEEGHAWCEAARRLAEDGRVPIDSVRIGHLDGDVYDPRCLWLRHRQIGSDGAVRGAPTASVAWRQPTAVDDTSRVLAYALGQVLARPVEAPGIP